MKKTISIYDFIDEFRNSSYENNFSHKGKLVLFDYLTELEEATGKEMELDIVAICCDFSEYKNFKSVQKNYNIETLEDLENETIVIKLDDGGLLVERY